MPTLKEVLVLLGNATDFQISEVAKAVGCTETKLESVLMILLNHDDGYLRRVEAVFKKFTYTRSYTCEYYKDSQNQMQGPCVEKYSNGVIQKKLTYLNSQYHGTYEGWFSNGKYEVISNWLNGVRNGIRIIFNVEGKAYMVEYWVHDNKINEIHL